MSEELPPLARYYCAYLDALSSVPRAGDFADYGWGKLPNPLSGTWLIYGQMFGDFAREIANTINQLVNAERRLGAWDNVMTPLDQEAQHELLIEFIEPLATLALNLPAVIRDRFIFAAAHLSHQANRAREGAAWEENLPADHRIKRADVERHGQGWAATSDLLAALETLASRSDYEDATGNFRNKYHHQFPARIGLGESGFVTRKVGEGQQTAYHLGGSAPLSLDTVRDFLRQQIGHAHGAYAAFKDLIREHEAAIIAWEAQNRGR